MITGNYNLGCISRIKQRHYTIPSDNRELQPKDIFIYEETHYTIPSDNRELQLDDVNTVKWFNYTIPSDNRELQLLLMRIKI